MGALRIVVGVLMATGGLIWAVAQFLAVDISNGVPNAQARWATVIGLSCSAIGVVLLLA